MILKMGFIMDIRLLFYVEIHHLLTPGMALADREKGFFFCIKWLSLWVHKRKYKSVAVCMEFQQEGTPSTPALEWACISF